MKILETIAAWFQPTYDQIKTWDFTPEQKELIDGIWEKLSPTIKKSLWALVTLILTKYGPDIAKALLEAILNKLKEEGIEIA